jgi:enamine deaminase RidA (YjgF/YER057c/UK114 family)
MHRKITPASIRGPFGNYSHGVLVGPEASWLVTSGQLGVSKDDAIPATISEQAVLCFSNIQAVLNEAGMSFVDVVRINAFVTRREDFAAYMEVRDRFVGDPPPASTLIIVTGFTRPEFLVEVEATAARIRGA